MPSNAATILSDATTGFRNNIRRMRSGSMREPNFRTKGKENSTPPLPALPTPPPTIRRLAVPNILVTSATRTSINNDPHRWDPVNGKIIIKIYVPVEEDIWKIKVPEGVSLSMFREKVELKLGYPVTFAESMTKKNKMISTEEQFQRWVATRVKDGRNRPLTTHSIL
ncbi:hypothetical protein C8Q75DRAFT_761403 [Abortiporus biennis]|nr:hypothetical protein C8Q75DRAFT_761403 [Abortiporus biennis]